jgi:hypothetical protein
MAERDTAAPASGGGLSPSVIGLFVLLLVVLVLVVASGFLGGRVVAITSLSELLSFALQLIVVTAVVSMFLVALLLRS